MEVFQHEELGGEGGFFVRMTHKEAQKTIASMASQMAKNDPNSTREEMFTDKGEYFTISVLPEDS